MKRNAIKHLIEWKNRAKRKPLIVSGARQVGKTWLIKEFGKTEYEQIAYINFEESSTLRMLFVQDFDINRILTAIQLETGIRVVARNTLIVFDEIQEAERGLTALKYFYENASEYHVIAAGSLLGVELHKSTSFPVGKVSFLNLYPLDFSEFMIAKGEQQLLDLLDSRDWQIIKTFKHKYIELLKQYYYVGGMPEVVSSFVENNDFNEVRVLQSEILNSFERDFSKHAPNEVVPRIRMLWNSIPAQLAKENKKFIYGLVKKGARAKEYELALSWLTDCGLVYKIERISKPGIPLKGYADNSAFKLFVVDLGLLCAMGQIDAATLLNGNNIFEEFKGALTEQYVLQQIIINHEKSLFYWSAEGGTAEIDFVVQHLGKVIPIEVKSNENLQAKSFKVYCRKYLPETAIRTSMSDFRKEDWFVNVPLYAIGKHFH